MTDLTNGALAEDESKKDTVNNKALSQYPGHPH